MPRIEYIGFVLRQQEKEPEDIVAACVAKFQDSGGKKVWKAYPVGETQFIPMLFMTSVLVREKFAHLPIPESGISEDKILLKKPNPRYDFILSYLSDVWKKEGKKRKYKAVYEDLRHATKFFFCPHGKDKTIHFDTPIGGMRPSQLFFWTVPDFLKKASLKELPRMPTELNILEDTPQSNQDILPGISELAEKVRLYLAQPKPWQELYKKALMPPEDLPKHQIPLCCSTFESNEKKQKPLIYKDQNLQLSEMLAKYGKILLTGPSGCGKTTIQKMLVAELLGYKPPIQDGIPIFVSLKYIGVEKKNVIDLIVDSVVDEILNSDTLKPTMRQQIDLRKARQDENMNLEQLFAREVREFFTSTAKNKDNKVVLFLDGYNEIPEAELHPTEQKIRELSERVNFIVVSSHSYCSFDFQPAFVRFELQELSDEQIISYLDHHLEDKGKQFFDDKLSPEGRILSMARIPFYLELIVEYHLTYPDRKLLMCRGPLLKFFVQKQYEKKKHVRKIRFPDLTEPDIDFFLRKVAYTLIDKGKGKAQTVLRYPDDLSDILPLSVVSNPSKIAQAAELIGFLDKSGQISEEPGAPGIISFKHDNIRDYFAAQEFKNQKVFDNPATAESYLEYTKWDNVWLMIFGMLDKEQEFARTLFDIAKLDPYFASRCLLASPLAQSRHADQLLALLPLTEIKKLKERLAPSSGWLTELLLENLLAGILSIHSPKDLCNIYCNSSTNAYVKSAVPCALLHHGENAVDYFKTMVKTANGLNHFEVLRAMSQLKNYKVYEFFVELLIQYTLTNSDTEHLPGFIRNWSGHLTVKQLFKNIEKARQLLGNAADNVMDAILVPLKHGRVGTEQDWLKLYHNSDSRISKAARFPLRFTGHPVVIDEIIKEFQLCESSSHHETWIDWFDLKALADSKYSAAEDACLRLLEELRSPHDCKDTLDILSAFDDTTQKRTLQKMAVLGLRGKCDCSMFALDFAARRSPELVKEIAYSEISSSKTNDLARNRLIIALALCNDKSINEELYDVVAKCFPRLANIFISPKQRKVINSWSFSCLCFAVGMANTDEIKSLLKNILKTSKSASVKSQAWRLNEYLEIKAEYRYEEISQLFHVFKQRLKKSAKKQHDIGFFWAERMRYWPLTEVKQVLEYTSKSAETALQTGDIKTAQYFCNAMEWIKNKQNHCRFLNIFRGWPGFLPRSLKQRRWHS